MVLHFNVTGESRKVMIRAIETELGAKAKYLAAPSFAYEIGGYRVERDGTLTFEEANTEESSRVIDACVMATGVSPAEWEGNEKGAKEAELEPEKGAEDENIELTVAIPIDKVAIGNLECLLAAKGTLIKNALGIDSLPIETDEENVTFHWFKSIKPDEALTYTKFIGAL